MEQSKDSSFAYAHFNKTIYETDISDKGELVQLVEPIYEGTTDLMGVSNYKSLNNEFASRMTGSVIRQDNLLNVLNYIYDGLKADIEKMPELDEDTNRYYNYVRTNFERNGHLRPDHMTEDSIDDLASKIYSLQVKTRSAQIRSMQQTNHTR
mgnify:CR=1 FL=1